MSEIKTSTISERLDLLWSFFKSKITPENFECERNAENTDEYNSVFERNKLMYGFASDAFSCSKFPQIVDDEEWHNLKKSVYYHGFEQYDYAANYLTDHKFHYGNGQMFDGTNMNGFYVTKDYNYAMSYTDFIIKKNRDENRILPLKLDDGKTINYMTLDLYMRDFVRGNDFKPRLLNDEENEKMEELFKYLHELKDYIKDNPDDMLANDFRFVLITSPATIALILGYDYIDFYSLRNNYFLNGTKVALNRGKVIVPRSKCIEMCEKSENYKHMAEVYSNEKQ